MAKSANRAVQQESSQNVPPSPFSAFLQNLKDTVLSTVMTNLKENIKERVERIEKKIYRSILSTIFFVAGIFFLLIALILFIHSYWSLSYHWGFLMVGIIAFLLSLIYKLLAKN